MLMQELEAIVDRALDKSTDSYATLDPYAPETRTLIAALSRLRDREWLVGELTKALKWYANPENYKELPVPTNVGQDGGEMARVALSKVLE